MGLKKKTEPFWQIYSQRPCLRRVSIDAVTEASRLTLNWQPASGPVYIITEAATRLTGKKHGKSKRPPRQQTK